MANKTRNDLVNQALSNLGVLAAGQTASTEDFETVDDHVDQVIAGLDADDIVTVFADEIPIELFAEIAAILADDAAPEFGMPGMPPAPGGQPAADAAKEKIRTRIRGRPTGEPLRTEYF